MRSGTTSLRPTLSVHIQSSKCSTARRARQMSECISSGGSTGRAGAELALSVYGCILSGCIHKAVRSRIMKGRR